MSVIKLKMKEQIGTREGRGGTGREGLQAEEKAPAKARGSQEAQRLGNKEGSSAGHSSKGHG